jgi:hypothetical protein
MDKNVAGNAILSRSLFNFTQEDLSTMPIATIIAIQKWKDGDH